MQGSGAFLAVAEPVVAPPAVVESNIPRPRLLAPLLEERPRLVLLCAPAGYGKSVLLNEALQALATEPGRVACLRLEHRPLSLESLCERLARAFGLWPERGSEALLDDLSRCQHPLHLVLEDLPAELPAEVDRWFDRLLALPDARLRLLVSCRQRPRWNLPRLILEGELLMLEAAQLAFTRLELQALHDRVAPDLDDESVDALWRSSEGWCAGVRLGLAGAGEELRSRLPEVLRAYLARELLPHLDDEERQLLRRLAYLPKFSAELCAQLWEGEGGEHCFRRLLRKQTYLLPVDRQSGWYRLLPMVAQSLHGSLDASELGRLRLQSCRLLSVAGHLHDAIEQALHAQQPEVAASYMERLRPDWQATERHLHRLLDWRAQLPAHLLESSPRLIYLSTLALLLGGRLREAEACLQALGRFLPYPDAQRGSRLLASWLALSGSLRALRGDAEGARRICREALADSDLADWQSVLLCYLSLARISMATGRLDEAQAVLDQAVELTRREGCLGSEVLINTDRVRLLLLQGETALGESLLQESLRLWAPVKSPCDPLYGRLLMMQGELHLQRGRLERGEDVLHAGLAQARSSSAPFVLSGLLALAEACSLRGRHEQALRYVQQGVRRMQCGRIDRALYEQVVALQTLRIRARQGRRECLLRLAAPLSEAYRDPLVSPPPLLYPSLPQEIQLQLAQVEEAGGERRRAWLRLRALALQCARYRFLALKEQAVRGLAALESQMSEAERAALGIGDEVQGEPEEEGGSAGESLSALAGAYLEALTPREISVLELLSRGLSNQEIGERLFISVNTVKYHAKNINTKLGTTRRTQAMLFARAMGLLA